MKIEPSETVVRAWARLVRAHSSALSSVEQALKAAEMPPLAWYDVLLELERSDSDGVRPFELERHLLLPQYGLSRLIDRMEAAGIVERLPCAEDGRGHVIAATKEGRTLRRRIWPVYARALAEAVGSRLSEDEAARLADLLGKLDTTAKGQAGGYAHTLPPHLTARRRVRYLHR